MIKEAFVNAMREGGDCYINYMSPVSKKYKYHTATINFSKHVSPYIHKKLQSVKRVDQDNQVLVFCYDLDDFKYIDLSQVISVVPLNMFIRQPVDG